MSGDNRSEDNNDIPTEFLPPNFKGARYRLADNWFAHVDVNSFKNRPIKYLEIGTFYGANAISMAKSYAMHPQSRLYCIDPWIDYEAYPQYKNQQSEIYSSFLHNIQDAGVSHKIEVIRGYSHKEVPKFEDDYFDIIYIDGNHEPEFVLEDAVLSFRKLKKGGIMVFDDYGWGGPDLTKRGIDGFLIGFFKKVFIIGDRETQVFLRKL